MLYKRCLRPMDNLNKVNGDNMLMSPLICRLADHSREFRK